MLSSSRADGAWGAQNVNSSSGCMAIYQITLKMKKLYLDVPDATNNLECTGCNQILLIQSDVSRNTSCY